MRRSILLLAIAVVALTGCKGFFGEKTDLEFIDKPEFQGREIAYVPIQPVLDGFVKPSQVLAGFDELIYVVDEGTSEIVSFDLSGRELARISVPGLKSITQDRKLDILAVGTMDTTMDNGGNPENLTLACVYRINQKQGKNLGLQYGTPKAVIIHPFYTGRRNADSGDELVNFTGIGCLGNNDYYIARKGPNEDDILSVLPAIDGTPDSRISRIFVQTSSGLEEDYFVDPSAITTLCQPPQNASVTLSRDFIYASTDANLALKVQYIKYEETLDGSTYTLKEFTTDDTSKADGFLYQPNKFSKPSGLTYAGDKTNYIFVVDSEKDSLYQFTNEGLEGVNPPAFSKNRKQIMCSFGGTGISLTQFNNPTSVAYFDKIVYVADAGNARVLRFKLTTDFD